jgi:hypothetical protein
LQNHINHPKVNGLLAQIKTLDIDTSNNTASQTSQQGNAPNIETYNITEDASMSDHSPQKETNGSSLFESEEPPPNSNASLPCESSAISTISTKNNKVQDVEMIDEYTRITLTVL